MAQSAKPIPDQHQQRSRTQATLHDSKLQQKLLPINQGRLAKDRAPMWKILPVTAVYSTIARKIKALGERGENRDSTAWAGTGEGEHVYA